MSKIFYKYKKEIFTIIGLIVSVMIISTYITYKQLEDSFSESYLNKLSVLKNSLSVHIKDYFLENEKVVITIASSKTTSLAISDLISAFSKIENEYKQKPDIDKLMSELKNYTSKIRYRVPGAEPKRDIKEYLSKYKNTNIVQQLYLVENPFGTSNKCDMYASREKLTYDNMHKKYHEYFLKELRRYDFYDMFLIDMDGNVVYSVFKEHDFGTNLKDGIYSKSSLADAFLKASKSNDGEVIFSDFRAYEPSYNKPASFMATPVYIDGKIIGVFAAQLSINKINSVMTLNESQKMIGLGYSGEAYLVGNDFYMRSDSRFIADMDNQIIDELSTSVGILKVQTQAVKRALEGENGSGILKDYREKKVYSSFAPLDIFNNRWAIVVEIDAKEVKSNIDSASRYILLTSVILTILFLLLLWYIFLRLILKPMEMQEKILAENIKLKEKELDASNTLLQEYKRAVDISSIVSKTTPSGIITYVNDSFCEISGYEREELIGKPHNVVRHPDMMRETFKDLWDTISRKQVWKGVVKNLKKNGGDYYVNSTIVPILNENNEVKEYMSIRSDITELINKEKQILKQTTDKTTKLPNRQKMLEDINLNENEMKLAIININKFKEVNDFYGIDVGDMLLISITSILKKIIDEKEISLYKINGDEFAILESQNISIHEFTKKITNIVKYFDHNIIVVGDNNFNIGLTIGISVGNSTKLFFNSEMALRKAVESSESIVSFENSHDIEKKYKENIEMTIKIKEAIRNDDIVIFTQPIKSNTNSGTDKVECLVRMRDGDKIISPFFFLETAKKARLYSTITKIVIEKSFRYFNNSKTEFSINLTIDDILNNDIVLFLKKKINEYKIGHRVVLELVESEGIENFEDVHKFIKEVKELGCKIAIDDFGTGYSNFEYLMKLDVDYIKIDGSLIRNVDHDKGSETVVSLIVDFAKQMNIKTIGEFVHNDSVYQKVKSLGIDYSQGYYLGEPMDMESI